MERSSHQICPKVDNCLGENGKHLVACLDKRGSEGYVGKTPLIPAESLCLSALQNHTESRARNPLVDTYSSVSYDIDRLLATPDIMLDENGHIARDSQEYKRKLVAQTASMLGEVPRLERVSDSDLWVAMQLKRVAIFMPAFRARAFGRPLDSALIGQTHDCLVGQIETLNQILLSRKMSDNHKKQVAAMLTENETMALLTRKKRADQFPWPALAREEASHMRSKQNHDFYTLSGGKKHAVQVKTSANGSGYQGVSVIQHYDILYAMKREAEKYTASWTPRRDDPDFEWPTQYTYEQVLHGPRVDPLGSLLVEEKNAGNRFDRHKRQVLDLATRYVTTRL